MKRKFLTLCITGLSVIGLDALAAPLQRSDLPDDPAWVLHLDCDGLRPTAIGQYILGEMDKPEAQAKLNAFQTIFSFDPRKQLHGLTLYGTTSTHEDGVLLVYADFDAERLATLAQGAKEYQSSKHNSHTIHSWIDDKKKAKNGVKPRVYAAIEGNRIIFGQREAAVGKALDVFDGAVVKLSTGKNFPQLGAPDNTSFIQGVSRKLSVSESDPNAALLRLSKVINLEVSEVQQQFTARLTLEAENEEVAKNIASIAQGMVSLLKLQKEKPEAVKLAEAVSLKQDGSVTVSTLTLPATDMVEMLKAGAARRAERRAEKN